MKAKTKSTRSATPYLVTANEDQNPFGGFAVDFQDLCAQEMDRALGIHKASLDSAVQLHSCAIEIYKAIDTYNNDLWFAPVWEALIDTTAKSFADCLKLHAHCMELHRSMLMLMAPYALSYREASSFIHQAAAAPEELASHMDIAIGAQHAAVEEAVVSHASRRSRRAAQAAKSEVNEMDEMDIAIGSRAA